MIKKSQIQAYAKKIAKEFTPEQIVLFGSYANGKPTVDSDVDMLVVMPHQGKGTEQAARIRQAVRSGFPLDLIVRSPKAIQKRLELGDTFIREILTKEKVLYEASHA